MSRATRLGARTQPGPPSASLYPKPAGGRWLQCLRWLSSSVATGTHRG